MKKEECKHCKGKGKVKSKFYWGVVDTTCMCCNGEKIIEVKEWCNNNREHNRAYQRMRNGKRTPKNRLDGNIGSLIYQAIKGKKAGIRWQKLVG